MSDEKDGVQALAGDTTPAPDTPSVPVDDGIIDLDALEEVKPEPAEGEEGEAKPEGEQKPEGDDKKKLSGAARAKLREQRLLNEIADRDRRLEELSRQTPAKTAGEGDDKPPEEKDYPDWFAWQRALTAHEAGKKASEAVSKVLQTREESDRSVKQAAAIRERTTAHLERVEDARDVIADFDQVMEGMKGVNVRQELIDEITSSDKSAYLTYHLAKNPDKLEALNALSGRELAREMGRLEASIELPTAKKQTNAPPPLKTPKGGSSPPSQEAILDSWMKKKYGNRGA